MGGIGLTEREGGAVVSQPGTRVLVVDDEPLMGTALRVAFEPTYDVVVASSGSEARSILQDDEAFDAIVCDLMMRDVSGIDLYRWLRERAPDLADRVVFVTGGAYTPEAEQFLGEVDNPRLQKPFSLDTLVDLVDAVVGAGRRG